MPRNVRNFWIETLIDGQRTAVRGGPAAKDGGFDMMIYQRDDGNVVDVLTVLGRVRHDGVLELIVRQRDGTEVIRVRTDR